MSRINHRGKPCEFLQLSGLAGKLLVLLALTLPALAASRDAANPAKPNAKASSKAPQALKSTSANGSTPVDTATVRRYYLEGDFDPAIDLLESTLLYKSGFSHADSVFLFKHLGVMYAAKYETREKGKHYMHRLLEVEPTARILDMYASDMIYMIFKNIQDEFDSRRRLTRADTTLGGGHGTSPSAGKEIPDPPRKKSSTYLWLGATAALAAAGGAATYFYFSDEPKMVTLDHKPD